jgi:choline kinase
VADTQQIDDIQASKRHYSAGLAKRLSGRLPALPTSSSRSSIISVPSEGSPAELPADQSSPHSYHRHRHHASERLLAQVSEWLEHERTKIIARQTKKVPSRRRSPPKEKEGSSSAEKVVEKPAVRARADSIDSQSSEVSLDRLQRILEEGMAAMGINSMPRFSPRLGRGSFSRHRKHPRSLKLQRTASSDTDFFDGDVVVPSADAVLDNSKTMSYSGGGSTSTDNLSISSKKSQEKDRKAWVVFKNEIIRLAHTLRLKGWRRVPLEDGDSISVERLSGALTNAVYVVSPPKDLEVTTPGKSPPPKLLLRIYGPQVEHLIDRENELSVLRRLARKRIGPRMLGTFTNGRFEQFFNATTLTPANLREPETSKQIAKRMRELHDGVELLESELDEGPGVWKNWDRWLENVEKRTLFLDKQVSTNPGSRRGSLDAWKARGYVCGVEWAKFKRLVEKYREYLNGIYGKPNELRDKLVFAHNDVSLARFRASSGS